MAIANGYRESKDSWRDLLLELRAREPQAGPLLAVGDGAMARWAALEEMFPQTRHQRCWFRKIGIVLSALTKSRHSRAKAELIPR
ncbi:transposase [Burkholderia stabilis]|nr:transposase [Burkholderia stabilis]